MDREAAFRRGAERQALSEQAERLRREAQRQLALLTNEGTRHKDQSDFYPYRYLAGEGFLPGYNFPALPVRAYLPRGEEGEYIARPRFLAIAEFAPENIIYHEGARYEVQRAYISRREPEKNLLRAKVCQICGYTHTGEDVYVDLCENCQTQLTGENSLLLTQLLEMPTVGTHGRARITCDEEERLRLGYNISTQFRFAPISGGEVRRKRAQAVGPAGEMLLELAYGPAAELWRVNHGWRRRPEEGFRLDLASGRWLGRGQEPREASAGSPAVLSNVRLFVRQTINVLLLYPRAEAGPAGRSREAGAFLATLQYALARGIQERFEIEESELGTERIGRGAYRGLLFWEAAEGGLGVLRRLVEEPDALAVVAGAVLEILHYDPATGADLAESAGRPCARACYDCLLSYYNQRDHRLLDRRLVRDFLLALKCALARPAIVALDYEEHYRWLRALTDTRSELERHLLDRLYAARRRLPDCAQHRIPGLYCIPDFFYEPNICVFCDGSVHDEPQQQARDREMRSLLEQKGYRVVAIRYDRDLEEQLRDLP